MTSRGYLPSVLSKRHMIVRRRACRLAIVIIVGMSCSAASADPAPCNKPPQAFTQRSRLQAMLSIHAHAYFASSRSHGRGLGGLDVLSLRDATETLRCDPSPGAWSRRRRAVAKLLAYGWPDPVDRVLIEEELGARIDDIVRAMQAVYGEALDRYLKPHPIRLETALLQLLADRPQLIPAPAGAPPLAPNECAQKWKPEQDPTSDDDSTSIAIHTYISISGTTRNAIAQNVDPQRWDECSKFWPTPAPESTCLATVMIPNTCELQRPDVACGTSQPFGSQYAKRHLYEHFVCTTPPCDCEFENVLNVSTTLLPHNLKGSTTQVDAYHVGYSLPVCALEKFEGTISGRIGTNNAVRASIDRGWLDVWEEGGRTHVEANKFVAFTNRTDTSMTGVVMGFTELNEELAEVACCLDGAPAK
jgi:hypothetical protein